ncbi:MAG TPA: hypothetical protein VFA94_11020 [Acidimicrobiales bacterium]|nr:hypothetical protein [Acidimicrobiales bacterium]
MTTIARWGLAAKLPLGWEARIFKRAPEAAAESTNPVLHAASFALPADRGDFGSGAVDLMGPDDVFVTVIEYDRSAAGTALFARQGLPRSVDRSQFSPTTLQRMIPGQAGAQLFFSDRGRAFCLYVVLGSWARADALIPKANALIAGLMIE